MVLWRGGRCREVKIGVNVWTVCPDQKKWPLKRGDHCKEVVSTVVFEPPKKRKMGVRYWKFHILKIEVNYTWWAHFHLRHYNNLSLVGTDLELQSKSQPNKVNRGGNSQVHLLEQLR